MSKSADGSRLLGAERVRELYGQPGAPIYAANLLLALVAIGAVALWSDGSSPKAVYWAALVVALEAMIAGLIWSFHRRERTDHEVFVWGRMRAGLEVLHGVGWALAVSLLHTTGEAISLLAVMVIIVGLVCGTTAGLAVHFPTLACFATAAMLPAALMLMMQDGQSERYAGWMLISTLPLVLANAGRMSLFYQEAIRTRLDLSAQTEEHRKLRVRAEESVAERTRFFGAASHDLRQPVHALGLYTALLSHDPPAKERRELIRSIAACVDGLERLFNAILGVSQAAKGADPDQLVTVRLEEVFDRVMLQFRPVAEQRGLALRRRPTSAWVRADPAVLERVLTNLVANALRYTESGGVLIGARRRSGLVDMVVADTGVGLSEADRKRIFDPFFQVRGSTGDRSQGYGLGLATVHQLCVSNGFLIDVQSRPGRGTTFRISLPQVDAQPAGQPAPSAAAVPARLNVLIVEDDARVADAISRLLRSWNVAVHMAASGDEALAALATAPQERWHALLDYRLPGDETGLHVADRIRERFGSRVPITLLTGEADESIFANAKRRGLLVLQKPLKPIRLRALLASAAAGPASSRRFGTTTPASPSGSPGSTRPRPSTSTAST